MMNYRGIIAVIMTIICCSTVMAMSNRIVVKSPDNQLSVEFLLNEGKPVYTVSAGKETVLNQSPLGLVRNDADFTGNLSLVGVSKSESVSDAYTLPHGKRSAYEYKANRRIVTLRNPQQKRIEIVFQVSNDGVAFCYRFPEQQAPGLLSVEKETTGFAFPEGTKSWLHPLHDSKTGWCETFPSYESHYEIEKPVGQPSAFDAGWAFPALFKTGQTWLLLSETNVDGSYCGCRLAKESPNGVYQIAFPQTNEHRGPQDPIAPSIQPPFTSPWRLIIVGRDLGTIVESTLASDLAAPSKVKDMSFIKPGRASWSWLRHDSQGTQLPKLNEYLDMGAQLEWEYMLVDCDWDRILGYDTVAELAKKADEKGVKLILWYNSNGEWNSAPMTPKNRMHIPEVRREEFKRIQAMGIKGIKVDFFGGDKQATMQLYMDILKDAAEYGIVCNFHGATLPRGWQRTWPHMVTTEAVMGMEYCTFDQNNTNQQPEHCCVLPYTRNVVAPMDFTPLVMDRKIRGVTRVTSPAFELALAVIFESGVQHFGLAPFEAQKLPEFAIDYLKAVPTAWDETRYVAGYPAKDVVLARRKGVAWYVAGINGEKDAKTMTLDLSFLPKGKTAILIADHPDNDDLIMKKIDAVSSDSFEIELEPYGGFVVQIQ